jgi:lipopolysaccharide export system protein LptC
MSELAERERVVKRGWAAPGGFHDVIVRLLKWGLPAIVLVFLGYLLISPLSHDKEVSFLLDKNKVATAKERLKTQAAEYRGTDDNGRAFTLNADRAIQATSNVPIIQITGVKARMDLKDGEAVMRADSGRYHMDQQKVDVDGPVHVVSTNGDHLETRDASLDLNTHILSGQSGVEGDMPLGHFTATTMRADLRDHKLALGGRVHFHIVQGGLKQRKKK